MLDIIALGLFHALLSLAAVAPGVASFMRQSAIRPRTRIGAAYVGFTVASCVTGLFIFRHGDSGRLARWRC